MQIHDMLGVFETFGHPIATSASPGCVCILSFLIDIDITVVKPEKIWFLFLLAMKALIFICSITILKSTKS